jgi:F420-dependent oxidoreductase-like protein
MIENHFGYDYSTVVSIALAAERLGFDGLHMCDHLVNQNFAKLPCLDPWVALGGLASVTSRLRLGTLVTPVGFRYPSDVAKMAASLDMISNGRFQLGLGAGWNEPEYNAYGIPFPPVGQRVRQLREALQIVRLMWNEEKPSFKGKYYSIKEAWCYPKPVQKPAKIWVGGKGERAVLKIVAELADGWNCLGTSPAEYGAKLEVLREHCRKAGRRIESIERSYYGWFLAGGSEEEFEELFEKHYAPFKKEDETMRQFMERVREAGRAMVGTVDQAVERIGEYAKLGVSYLILYFPDRDPMGSMRLFSEKIMPLFPQK